jgi:2'-5' RNA ligase
MSPLVPGETALVILLTPAAARAADRWRQLYDPNMASVPPHITLVYPFRVQAAAWPAERPTFAHLLAGFPAFRVSLVETGVFTSPSRVLWLKPQDDGSIQRLHTALLESFPRLVLPNPLGFVPHVTLGFFDSDAALQAARQAVQAGYKPVHFIARRITCLTYTATGAWQVLDELRLGCRPRPCRTM